MKSKETMFSVIIGLIFLPIQYLLEGVAVSYMWSWFVVDFFNAPELSLALAIGLSIFVSYLTMQAKDKQYDDSIEAVPHETAVWFSRWVVLFGSAFIVSFFV